jgi:hypothetical protein
VAAPTSTLACSGASAAAHRVRSLHRSTRYSRERGSGAERWLPRSRDRSGRAAIECRSTAGEAPTRRHRDRSGMRRRDWWTVQPSVPLHSCAARETAPTPRVRRNAHHSERSCAPRTRAPSPAWLRNGARVAQGVHHRELISLNHAPVGRASSISRNDGGPGFESPRRLARGGEVAVNGQVPKRLPRDDSTIIHRARVQLSKQLVLICRKFRRITREARSPPRQRAAQIGTRVAHAMALGDVPWIVGFKLF